MPRAALPAAVVSTPDVRTAARAFLADQPAHFDTPVMLIHLNTVEAKSAAVQGSMLRRGCSLVDSTGGNVSNILRGSGVNTEYSVQYS